VSLQEHFANLGTSKSNNWSILVSTELGWCDRNCYIAHLLSPLLGHMLPVQLQLHSRLHASLSHAEHPRLPLLQPHSPHQRS